MGSSSVDCSEISVCSLVVRVQDTEDGAGVALLV